MTNNSALLSVFREHLTEEDFELNSTLQSLDTIESQLRHLEHERDRIQTILDVGCNRGGFAAAIAHYLDAETVYGIDIDESMRNEAEKRGISTFDVNVETEPFPFADDSVDLVLAFGLIEHLRYYDNLFRESQRVLEDGWFWVTSPNLGSWLNRLALIVGYQPRNVELSSEYAAGSLPIYDRNEFLDHVHAPTYRSLVELLEYYEFEPIESVPLSPYRRGRTDALLDAVFTRRIGLSRRLSILSRQV